jgi:predicted DNA-binding transcriptional regulator YafY
LNLTADFVAEILSMGNQVTVEAPKELRAMVVTNLKATLANYPEI